MIVEDQ